MKYALLLATLAAAISAGAADAARADTFAISYEQPNVTATTVALAFGGVETFDSLEPGVQSFTTTFGTGGVVSGAYSNVNIVPADQFGGAGATGYYPDADFGTSYSIALSTTSKTGLNYFGGWMTAVDMASTVTFYNGATQLGVFELTAVLPTSVTANPDYLINKAFYNNHEGQPFVFMNFIDTSGTFNKVVFTEATNYPQGGNFESDNHTVGYAAVAGVPEVASWVFMLIGAAGAGAALRGARRSRLA